MGFHPSGNYNARTGRDVFCKMPVITMFEALAIRLKKVPTRSQINGQGLFQKWELRRLGRPKSNTNAPLRISALQSGLYAAAWNIFREEHHLTSSTGIF